jgi:hypothetical protein
MKLLACLITTSFLLTSCGNGEPPQPLEPSPLEKRNSYDACMGKYLEKYFFMAEKDARVHCYKLLE